MTRIYNRAVAIALSDTVDQPSGMLDALYVGGAGNIVGVLEDGSTVTMAVVAGAILPIKFKRINNTSTTATGLFALYET